MSAFDSSPFTHLPVGHGSIEDLFHQVFHHLRDEFFLYGVQTLRCVVALGRGKLALEVLGMVLVVGESHIDSHRQLGLCRVSLTRYRLVSLAVLCDFSLYLEVSISLHLYQSGVAGGILPPLIVLNRSPRAPDKGTAKRELGKLYGLGFGIVDAGTIEGILYRACSRGGDNGEDYTYYIYMLEEMLHFVIFFLSS